MGPIEFGLQLNAIVEDINSSNINTLQQNISKIYSLLDSVKGTDRYKECQDILRLTLEHEYVMDTEPEIDYSKAVNYSRTMSPTEKANYLVQNLRMVLGEQKLLNIATSPNTHDKLDSPLKQNSYRVQSENFRDEGKAVVDILKRIHGDKKGINFRSCKISNISELLKKQGNEHEFTIATIDGKKYIIDIAYRQFFALTHSNQEEGHIDPGIFMMREPDKKKVAEQILKYGFIEATPENLENYISGFILSSLGRDAISDSSIPMPPIEFYEEYLGQESNVINMQQSDVTKRKKFITDSEPYIQSDYSDEYNIHMTDEEVLTNIVQKERRYLMQEHDLIHEGLAGACEGSTKRIMLDCTSKGLDDAVFLCPKYYVDDPEKIESHNCTIVQLNGKSYLIDCTYRQFFIEESSTGKRRQHCGEYMVNNDTRKRVANQILKYGWIQATPENIKAYIDGFIMAGNRSATETGISAEEYVRRLAEHSQFPIQIVNSIQREYESDIKAQSVKTKKEPQKSFTEMYNEYINQNGAGDPKKISPEKIKEYSSEIEIGIQDINGVTQETREIITQKTVKSSDQVSK